MLAFATAAITSALVKCGGFSPQPRELLIENLTPLPFSIRLWELNHKGEKEFTTYSYFCRSGEVLNLTLTFVHKFVGIEADVYMPALDNHVFRHSNHNNANDEEEEAVVENWDNNETFVHIGRMIGGEMGSLLQNSSVPIATKKNISSILKQVHLKHHVIHLPSYQILAGGPRLINRNNGVIAHSPLKLFPWSTQSV